MGDTKKKSLSNLNRSGRAIGSKNKSTLVREALRGDWDDLLVTEGVKVFKAVVESAQGNKLYDKDGNPVLDPVSREHVRGDPNIAAAKLILDRVIPVTEDKLSGKIKIGEGGLNIYIEKLEATPAPVVYDGEAEDAQFEEA